MDAVAVEHARLHARQIAVPDFVGIFRQLDPGDLGLAALVIEAEFDPLRMGRKQRKIRTLPIEARAQRMPFTGFDCELRAASVHGDILDQVELRTFNAAMRKMFR